MPRKQSIRRVPADHFARAKSRGKKTVRTSTANPFRLTVEAYASREAIAYADLSDDRNLTVRVGYPGTYVTAQPSVRVEVQFRNIRGAGGFIDQHHDVHEIDVYADDLESLVATLAEAVRIAREEGVIPPQSA